MSKKTEFGTYHIVVLKCCEKEFSRKKNDKRTIDHCGSSWKVKKSIHITEIMVNINFFHSPQMKQMKKKKRFRILIKKNYISIDREVKGIDCLIITKRVGGKLSTENM